MVTWQGACLLGKDCHSDPRWWTARALSHYPQPHWTLSRRLPLQICQFLHCFALQGHYHKSKPLLPRDPSSSKCFPSSTAPDSILRWYSGGQQQQAQALYKCAAGTIQWGMPSPDSEGQAMGVSVPFSSHHEGDYSNPKAYNAILKKEFLVR